MPLSDISVNIVGRPRNAGRYDNPRAAKVEVHGENPVGFDSSLASIHGMLKNTTETGDIGQFSIKSAPTPHPVALVPPESPTYLHHHLNLPKHQVHQLEEYTYHGQRRVDNWPRTSMLDYRGTGASSMVSLRHYGSQESVNLRPRHLVNGPLAFPLLPNFHVGYGVSRHQLHTSPRPRSPFAYPTRLKRPGYRPASPALVSLHGVASGMRGDGEQVKPFRTSSPLSLHAGKRIPLNNRYDPNRSVPSVPSLSYSHNTTPSPLTRFKDGAWSTPSGPSQGPTPQPSPRQSTTYYDGQFGETTAKGRMHQQSPSPVPLFYDYTEAFEEEYRYHSANLSVVSLVGQIIPEDEEVETYHELEGDLGVLPPAELPTQYHASPASSKAFRHTLDSPSPSSIPGKVLAQMASWMNVEGDGAVDTSLQTTEREREDSEYEEGNKIYCKEGTEPGTSDADTMGHHILSSSKRRIQALSVLNPYRAASCPNFRRASVLPTLPSNRLSGQAEPPRKPPMVCEDKNATNSDTNYRSSRSWRIPSMNFDQLEAIRQEDVSNVETSQASRNDTTRQVEGIEICAPVAERPVSIQSRKERLSRILSINEASAELANVVKDRRADKVNGPTSDSIAELPATPPPHDSITNLTGKSVNISIPARLPTLEGKDSNQSVPVESCALGENSEEPVQGRLSTASNAGHSRSNSEDLQHIDSRNAYPWTSMYHRTFNFPPAAARPKLHVSMSHKTTRSTLPTTESHISRGSEDASSMSRTVSYVSVPPRTSSVSEQLPFAFTPLINVKNKTHVPAEGHHGMEEFSDTQNLEREIRPLLMPKFKLKMRAENSIKALFQESQSGQLGESAVVGAFLNESSLNTSDPAIKPPKFRLKVTKPTSSTDGTVRARNGSAPSLTSLTQRWAVPSNLFQPRQCRERGNSEDTAVEESGPVPAPIRTRFTEALDTPSASPPFITLSPPSPGLHLTE
ncbi:MAG: hypothetical protein Q9187_003142, partial [Circinaria calcarea]